MKPLPVLFVLALLAGCAAPSPQPTTTTAPQPSRPPSPPAASSADERPSDSVAVAGLLKSARADVSAGRLANAAASLERGLRIEPRNPRLWQELARVRLKQREYAQAESTASRSNSWAGSDNTLRVENWRIIAESREARGDARGARAALEAASRIGR